MQRCAQRHVHISTALVHRRFGSTSGEKMAMLPVQGTVTGVNVSTRDLWQLHKHCCVTL
jgi:hypothetical protein